MFKRKPIGPSKLTDKQDMEKKKQLQNKQPDQGNKTTLIYVIIGLAIACVISTGLFVKSMLDNKGLVLQKNTIEAKIRELSIPKYDEVNDFLLKQCDNKGFYCLSTQTNNPSLEIMKFLVNFRETPGYQYRMFFQLRLGGEQETTEQLKCDGENADFYICQEITAANPTDVMRAFEVSYRSLSSQATYNFDLMVKPIGELQYAKPVKMTATQN